MRGVMLFCMYTGSKESQKTFAEDDQHLLAYGMMEAGKNVERDFAGVSFFSIHNCITQNSDSFF